MTSDWLDMTTYAKISMSIAPPKVEIAQHLFVVLCSVEFFAELDLEGRFGEGI